MNLPLYQIDGVVFLNFLEVYLLVVCIKYQKNFGLLRLVSQVGFAEFNNTADNRANIGGTIIGAPIVGQ